MTLAPAVRVKNSRGATGNRNMEQITINQIEKFVKDSFVENPSYSFNDWTIMYEHSLKVKDIALQIAESIDCNKELLTIMALLHDIGKAYKTDEQILQEHHDELGYEVAKDFLPLLNLSEKYVGILKGFLSGNLKSIEVQIVKEADIIAFFSDKNLQQALKNWADKQDLLDELQRKADKFKQLEFSVSKEIARPLYEEMKKQWHLK